MLEMGKNINVKYTSLKVLMLLEVQCEQSWTHWNTRNISDTDS